MLPPVDDAGHALDGIDWQDVTKSPGREMITTRFGESKGTSVEVGDAATWASVGVALIAACIAFGSMTAAKRSAEAAEKQAALARRSAAAAEKQAKAADVAAKAAQEQTEIMRKQVRREAERLNREDRPDFEYTIRKLDDGSWRIRIRMIKGVGSLQVHPVWFTEPALSNAASPADPTHKQSSSTRLNVHEGTIQQLEHGDEFEFAVQPLPIDRSVVIQVHLHCVEVGGKQRSWMWLKAIDLP